MSFWITTVPTWVWSAVYLVPIALVNLASVSAFGETEFVLSSTKVLAIIVFLIISFFVWFGVGTGTKPLWFTNWDPAINGATPGDQVTNIANAMLSSFFSFGGCELIGLTAGEAVNPRTTVPRAINGTFYRILIFYVGSIFALGVLVRSDSPVLDPNNPDGLLQSPFVYVYSLVGIRAASHIMNAVIIIAVLSALNSSIYACSRTLSQLATDGYAPKLFASVTSNGVPMPAVLVSIAFGSVAIIGGYVAQREGPVFNFLSNFIALSIMINWVSMSYVHLRFRYGYLAQGRSLKDLPYVAPFFPWADLISIVFGILVAFLLVFFAFYQVTEFGMDWYIYNSWLYCGIPVFVLSFVGKGVYDGVKSGKGLWSGFSLVKFEDMDFETGKWVEDFELNEANKKGMNSLATPRGTASCVWDIESCPIPSGIPGSVVVQRLNELLLQRKQICTGLTAVARSEYLSLHLRSELDSGGVAVLGVNPSTVDIALVNEIMKDIFFRRPPHSIILIGGDRDLSSVIHFLETVKYSVTLIHNQNVLPHRCKDAFPWTSFLSLGRREILSSTLMGTRGNSFPDIRSLELASGRRQLLLPQDDHFIPPPRETSAPSARMAPSQLTFQPTRAQSHSTQQPVINSNNMAYVFKQKVVNSARIVELEGAHFPENCEKGAPSEFFAFTGATGSGPRKVPSAFFARQASMENAVIMNQPIPRKVSSQILKDPVMKSPSAVEIKSAYDESATAVPVSPAKKSLGTGFESVDSTLVSNSLKSPGAAEIKSAHESSTAGALSPKKKTLVTGFEAEGTTLVSNSSKSPGAVEIKSAHESSTAGPLSPGKKSLVTGFEAEGVTLVSNSLKSPAAVEIKSAHDESSNARALSPNKKSLVTGFEAEGVTLVSNSSKSSGAVEIKSAHESSTAGALSPKKKSPVTGVEAEGITLVSNSLSTEHFARKPALENRVIAPPPSKPLLEVPQLTAAQIFKQQVLDALRASEMKSASLHTTPTPVPTKNPQQPAIKPQVPSVQPVSLPDRDPSTTPKTHCRSQLSTAAQIFKQKVMNSIRTSDKKTVPFSHVSESASANATRSTGAGSTSLDSPSASLPKEYITENTTLVHFSHASESVSTNDSRSTGAGSLSLDSPSASRPKDHFTESATLVNFSHACESVSTPVSQSTGAGSLTIDSPLTSRPKVHFAENDTLVNGPSVSQISTDIPKMLLGTGNISLVTYSSPLTDHFKDKSNASIEKTCIASKDEKAPRDGERRQVEGPAEKEQTYKKYPKSGERAYNLLRKIQQLAVEKRQSMRENPVLGADPRVHLSDLPETLLQESGFNSAGDFAMWASAECNYIQFDSAKKVVSLAAGATPVLMQLQNCDGSDLIERANVLDLVDTRFHVLVNCMFDLKSGGISVAKDTLLTMLSVNLSRFVGQGFSTPLQYCAAALEANVIAGDVTTGLQSAAFSLVQSKKAHMTESSNKGSGKLSSNTHGRVNQDGLLRAQFDYLVEIFKNRGKSALSMPVLIAILGNRRGRFVFKRGGRKFIETAAGAGVVTIYRPKRGRTGDMFVRLMPQSLNASNPASSSRIASSNLEGAVKTWAEAAGLEELDKNETLFDNDEGASESASESGGESEQFFEAEEFL
ncbi:hypothetical protein HDU77_008541 [Chytriomyces hyalinus]|nr:hypothetical protein HDU77_008541 [Chytriomyces hyalinus]